MTRFFLGLDAGNSKTVALVADHAGRILGRGRGGVGDIYGAPTEAEAVREVLHAVHAALDAASLLPVQVDQAAFRLAGIDWVEDERYWREALAAHAHTHSDPNPWLVSMAAGPVCFRRLLWWFRCAGWPVARLWRWVGGVPGRGLGGSDGGVGPIRRGLRVVPVVAVGQRSAGWRARVVVAE